jgi:hypothetical protein
MNIPYVMIMCSQRIEIYDQMISMIRESMTVYEKDYFMEMTLFCDNDDSNKRNFLLVRPNQESYIIYKSKSFEKKVTKVLSPSTGSSSFH